MDNRPVGVFDSGLGGLTAVRAIQRILPGQDIIYLGDTARVPYGSRSPEVITRYALACTRELLRRDIKALVVACGTVSTVALPILTQSCPIPVLGVVEPTCRAAVSKTVNKRVGMIATAATVASRAYERVTASLDTGIEVFSKACPLLVPLVENGRFKKGDAVAETVVAEYLESMRDIGVDTLMLGCTHYPLLKEIIAAYMSGVTLVDAGEEVANALNRHLTDTSALPPDGAGQSQYLVTDSTETFARFAEMFLQNSTNGLVEGVDIEIN